MDWTEVIKRTKKAGVLTLMFWLTAAVLSGQTLEEWTKQKQLQTAYKLKQIAGLRAYADVVKKGYRVAETGWNAVGSIRNGEYSLHRDYFSSLSGVHRMVSSYPQAENIIRIAHRINLEVERTADYLKRNGRFTTSEKGEIIRYNRSVLLNSETVVSELKAVLTSSQYEMKDGERMAAVDGLASAIEGVYRSLTDFNKEVRLIGGVRNRKVSDQEQLNSLYDVR